MFFVSLAHGRGQRGVRAGKWDKASIVFGSCKTLKKIAAQSHLTTPCGVERYPQKGNLLAQLKQELLSFCSSFFQYFSEMINLSCAYAFG